MPWVQPSQPERRCSRSSQRHCGRVPQEREKERHCGRGERSDLFFSWLAGCGEAGLRVGGAEEGATLGAAASCYAAGGAVAAGGVRGCRARGRAVVVDLGEVVPFARSGRLDALEAIGDGDDVELGGLSVASLQPRLELVKPRVKLVGNDAATLLADGVRQNTIVEALADLTSRPGTGPNGDHVEGGVVQLLEVGLGNACGQRDDVLAGETLSRALPLSRARLLGVQLAACGERGV